jgi:hypothetical protein
VPARHCAGRRKSEQSFHTLRAATNVEKPRNQRLRLPESQDPDDADGGDGALACAIRGDA